MSGERLSWPGMVSHRVSHLEGRHLKQADMDQDSFQAFRSNNFDLIRLFAAFQVLIMHSMMRLGLETPVWLKPFEMLHGVPIFFAISGFLVSASYERSSGLGRYARARALRIFPGLWVCVTITTVLVLALGYPMLKPSGLVWYLLQLCGVIYTPGALAGFGIGSYNGSLWTIPIELQFYVMIPILYGIARRFQSRGWVWVAYFVAFMLLAMALDAVLPRQDDGKFHGFAKIVQYTFTRHIYMFVFGIILQRFKLYSHPAVRGRFLVWLVVTLALSYAEPYLPFGEYWSRLALGITAISAAYSAPGLGETLLRGQDVSYGLYIYHGLFINLLVQFKPVHSYGDVAVVLAATAVTSVASWLLVERPAIRLKRNPAVPAR